MHRQAVQNVFILIALVATACPVLAQSTEADLKTRLKKTPLYLRGCWGDSSLSFDANGKLVSSSSKTSFTLSGFGLKSLQLKNGTLALKANGSASSSSKASSASFLSTLTTLRSRSPDLPTGTLARLSTPFLPVASNRCLHRFRSTGRHGDARTFPLHTLVARSRLWTNLWKAKRTLHSLIPPHPNK